MHRGTKRLMCISLLLMAITGSPQGFTLLIVHADDKHRTVTVEDAIRMTHLASPNYLRGGPSAGQVAQFSPDGKRFAIVLESGNLQRNITVYSLFVFETARIFSSLRPKPIVVMSSSSNREGIKGLKWLVDNQTLVFLGETPNSFAQ